MSEITLHVSDIRKLAAAVINMAISDARIGRQNAILWFSSQDAQLYLDILGLEQEVVVAMARAGFPKDQQFELENNDKPKTKNKNNNHGFNNYRYRKHESLVLSER